VVSLQTCSVADIMVDKILQDHIVVAYVIISLDDGSSMIHAQEEGLFDVLWDVFGRTGGTSGDIDVVGNVGLTTVLEPLLFH